jgi:phage/plasmid-like protein (TIGR03299 family)
MAHNLDFSTGKAGLAFIGDRRDIWHRLGQAADPSWTLDQWLAGAGLDWTAIKVPAVADLASRADEFPGLTPARFYQPVPNGCFNVRSDTLYPLGFVSDNKFQNVQPRELGEWFERYTGVDDRFRLDTAGCLGRGETIWFQAVYSDNFTVAGDAHKARLLATTAFDGSGATTVMACLTKTVCQNTLTAAMMDRRAAIKVRHSAKFDAEQVATELAEVCHQFEVYKAMGDAMAQVHMAGEDTARFFKTLLEIPFDTSKDKLSTRKLNQFDALRNAWATSVDEGCPKNSVWAALNAVTRYVDHDRASRGDVGDADLKRFTSANFGSGAALKGKAVDLLLPLIKDRVPVAV